MRPAHPSCRRRAGPPGSPFGSPATAISHAGTRSSSAVPRPRSSTVPAGRRSSKRSSVTGRSTFSPSARPRSSACCRSRRSEAGSSATRSSRCRSASTGARPPPTRPRCPLCTPPRASSATSSASITSSCATAIAREPGWPRQDLYVTFRKEILPEVEANMLAIPRKQRAMVRKGIAARAAQRARPVVDRFFALYADNVHRHGTPAQSRRYFAGLAAASSAGRRGAHRPRAGRAAGLSASCPSTSATKCCPTTPATP